MQDQSNRTNRGARAGRRCVALTYLIRGALLAGCASLLGGCAIGALVGGVASNAERTGSKQVKVKYPGLEGKSFAVVVAADRSISGEHPDIVPMLTREISRRLADNSGATAMVPAEDILRFQYQRPGWVAMSPRDLAKELEVDRLIFIDLQDYSLTDPGNRYIWNGAAAGVVHVLEVEKSASGEFGFREPVRVKYPDQEGLSEYQISGQLVALELARRFINRASWPFYQHEEPNAEKY